MKDIEALTHGALAVEGRMPWSSNYTFLLDVEHDGDKSKAIYKPEEGEKPLSDFPGGLHKREAGAYTLANALGWPNVPPTIEREDAPFGIGSLQKFIDANFEEHYFTLMGRDDLHDTFIDIATFDVVANNADRKSGHCILGNDGSVYAIDHGLCFHEEVKLRTVIWDFGGEEIPERCLVDLRRILPGVTDLMGPFLTDEELEALVERIEMILAEPVLPFATSEYQFPWPLI